MNAICEEEISKFLKNDYVKPLLKFFFRPKIQYFHATYCTESIKRLTLPRMFNILKTIFKISKIL